MINNKGNLTITGNGKISFTDTGAGDPNFGWGSYTIRNEGTLVVENGTIEHLGEQDSHCIQAIFQYSGSTTIKGGTISTPYYRSVRLWNGTMTITGGTFNGRIWVQNMSMTPSLIIEGGKFVPVDGDDTSVYVSNSSANPTFKITGGTFEGKIGAAKPEALAGAITGGKFNETAKNGTNVALMSETLAFSSNADANGYYTIVNSVASVNGVGYATLQAAINAVQNGETIVLIADIKENVTLTEKTGLYYIIDGNGKKLNGTITVSSLSDTNDNRRITIKNIDFVTTNGRDFITSTETNHYPRLTVEGCSFTGTGAADTVAIRLKSSHSVVIKDCTGSGLHSFLQNTSGWNLTVENVTVTNSKSGLALGTVQGVTVKGCNIDVNGYGIRLDTGYNNNAVIESNTVKAFIPVVVRKASVASNVTFNGTNTMTATNTDGVWLAIGTTEYEANGALPTAATAKVNVVLKGTGLNGSGIYGALLGSGDATDPYQIGSLADLIIFRDSVNAGKTWYNRAGAYVVLTADIDLASVANWTPIGNWDYSFDANFNGQGHKIMNLKMSDDTAANGEAYLGFFGITANNTVENFVIENVTINSNGQIVAAAIAYPYYTTVKDITVCGDIAIKGGNYTAGVLGYTRLCVNASNLTVSGNDGSYITGAKTVGGVLADLQMNHGLVANYSNFSVSGVTITGDMHVGGIAGIIATQTLNGASVKNVTLVCSDARVGIVAGSLGGTATVSNVTVENVTGATAIIGAAYDTGAAVEAKIGDTYYKTFADA